MKQQFRETSPGVWEWVKYPPDPTPGVAPQGEE